jgi:hypothetical protein
MMTGICLENGASINIIPKSVTNQTNKDAYDNRDEISPDLHETYVVQGS